MNMVGCDSEAIRYRDTVVHGYDEGNRLAKWYWDCEHHKSLRVNAGIRMSLGSRLDGGRTSAVAAVTMAFFVMWSLSNV